jgi:hypothetical protein
MQLSTSKADLIKAQKNSEDIISNYQRQHEAISQQLLETNKANTLIQEKLSIA